MKNSIFGAHAPLYRDTAGASTGNAFTDHSYRPGGHTSIASHAQAKRYTALGLEDVVTGPGSIVIEPRGGSAKRQAMKQAKI